MRIVVCSERLLNKILYEGTPEWVWDKWTGVAWFRSFAEVNERPSILQLCTIIY